MSVATLVIDQSAQYNSNPITVPNGGGSPLQTDVNGFLKVNQRLLTPTDIVSVQPVAGQPLVDNAQLYDGFGNPIRSITPTTGINLIQAATIEHTAAYVNWNGVTINTTGVTYGTVTVRNYRVMEILVAISAVNTAINFFYDIQDANGNFVNVWTETETTNANFYKVLGPGFPNGTGGAIRNISLGSTGRLRVTATGTSGVLTGSVWFAT
jgi:hypothetical protein